MGHLNGCLTACAGPSGRGEVGGISQTLIDWLNTDQWPQDQCFDGPALTPAAIERKLRIAAMGPAGDEGDLDADKLGRNRQRLVHLGAARAQAKPGLPSEWHAAAPKMRLRTWRQAQR
jgi:hypothetical protein